MWKRKAGAVLLTLALLFAAHPGVCAQEQPGSDEALLAGDAEPPGDLCEVNLPSDFTIFIDPYDIFGRGQVYSQELKVANNGAAPVYIVLSDVRCTYVADDVQLRGGTTNPDSRQKEIQLSLVRQETGESLPFLEEAEGSLEFMLDPDEAAVFEVTGTVSVNPERDWASGDVRVNMTFAVEQAGEAAPILEEQPWEEEPVSPSEEEQAPEPETPSPVSPSEGEQTSESETPSPVSPSEEEQASEPETPSPETPPEGEQASEPETPSPVSPSEGEQASEPETASPASSETELASNSASSAEPEAISEPEEAPASEAPIESTPATTE